MALETALIRFCAAVFLSCVAFGCASEPKVPDLDILEAKADAKGEQRIQQLERASVVDTASAGIAGALLQANGVNCVQFVGNVVGRLMGPGRGALKGNLFCGVEEGGLRCDPGAFWKTPVQLSLSASAQGALGRLAPPQVVCKPSPQSKRIWTCGAQANGGGDTVEAITADGRCARF